MTHDELVSLIGRIRSAATQYECDIIPEEPVAKKPCQASDLNKLREHFGEALPNAVQDFFTTTTAHLEFSWYLMGDLPAPFSGITCGGLTLSPDSIIAADLGRASWAKEVYPNVEDPYDKLWQSCYGLVDLECGDFLAWDDLGRIVYLSHDGMTDWHGYVLARNFEDLIRNYLLLGAPEPEFGWEIFTEDSESGISASSEVARLWIELFFPE